MTDHKPIDFYFEFSSPYGYFASLKIDGLAATFGRRVNWRPFMLGAVFKITGGAPLMNLPMKGDYFRRDVERCAKLLDVPFTYPDVTPMNSLAACRAYYWLSDDDPGKAKELAQSVYNAFWGLGRDMSDADEVARVATAHHIDGEALVAAIQDDAIKQRLKDETDAAIERGVFGSPFFFVDGEPFWGHDRMDQLERWLGTGGW